MPCPCCRWQTATGRPASAIHFQYSSTPRLYYVARGTIDIDNEDDSFVVKGIGWIDIGSCYLLFIIVALKASFVFILPAQSRRTEHPLIISFSNGNRFRILFSSLDIFFTSPPFLFFKILFAVAIFYIKYARVYLQPYEMMKITSHPHPLHLASNIITLRIFHFPVGLKSLLTARYSCK